VLLWNHIDLVVLQKIKAKAGEMQILINYSIRLGFFTSVTSLNMELYLLHILYYIYCTVLIVLYLLYCSVQIPPKYKLRCSENGYHPP
jgi:hypothetical protein